MTATPNSHVGLAVICPTCQAPENRRCKSNTGRELRTTHLSRMRAELAADPVRRWLAERREWATG